MQNTKSKTTTQVHVLTEKTAMKFIPLKFPKTKVKSQSNQMHSSVKQPKLGTKFLLSSLIWRKNKTTVQASTQPEENPVNGNGDIGNQIQDQRQALGTLRGTETLNIHKLNFAYKLSPEHMLVGNEFQLDLISILGINSNHFVQTQFLWSITHKDPIKLVGVDQKKQNLFAIVAGRTLIIYKYDAKKLTTEPLIPFKQIPLTEDPKFLQVVKDGNICLFYQQRLEIYLAAEQVRKRYNKEYQRPPHLSEKTTYTLFMIPEPFDNILNVFFQEKNEDNAKIFRLWCTQIEFQTSQIKPNPPQKIYDIKSSLRNTINLKNYSKEIFLMNLGSEILALKKGYILDSATVNLKHEESFLQYIGNDTLLHISQKKIEVYSFVINMNIKPYRIIIKPKDSIRIQQNDKADEFFKVFQMLSTNDLMVLYQKNTQTSFSRSGQIQYSFYVTRSISRQAKMNLLFPLYKNEDLKIDDPALLDKCDMAQKMGLTTREIYLQLWNRSQQSRKQDYSILIATKDYNTINQEIIRKLKKASMNFKQIQNIEQACFVMLEQKVFSSSCTEEAVMDYISSHFFRRKLEMWKDIQLMEKFEKEQQTGKQENEGFKMTIRQYQEYKSMEIKSHLIQLVNQFCHEGKKAFSKNIRFLLRNFKFVFRTIYYDLLESIIKNAKDKLLDLLKQIPQLLPYHPSEVEQETTLQIPVGFYEGVWPEISKQEWNTSLYVDAITTIDNKEIILEHVIKNINFKRNWLSQHDMVIESVQKIKANYEKIKSPVTFYFFAAKIFEYIQNYNALKEIVDFLQATYELPANIKGNIFLNERLYKFFIDKRIAPQIQGRPYTLSEFFSFEDKQLIRHCFDKERSNKGLLLKDIKSIFKQVLQDQADQKYNNALLNYFISDLSQVSDLKYILNRINNQKLEFHHENQQMYVILVEALERKLKIGTGNDIPIEEVLIYIQNIPLDQNSAPLHELKAVEKIEKESEMLRQAKVNMSIYDILHNEEQVFTKLISHIVDTAEPSVWEDYASFNKFAINSIAKLEIFAQQIYETNYNKVIFLSFLSKVCQLTERIKFADYLLKNEEFSERVNENTTEGLVLLMFKWKLSQQKQFVRSEQYLKQLLKLLPSHSNIYKYNKNELQFAKILSAPNYPVTYPISDGYITAADVRDIIFDLPIQFVMELDVIHLHEVISQMEDGLIEDLKEMGDLEGADEQFITAANRITLHQIYEFVIIKMINSNKLREVLPYIKSILDLEIADPTYNIIYIILYIIQLAPELTQSNKNNLIQCISHYFYDAKGLLQILEYLMTNPLSTYQAKTYIQTALQSGKKKYKGYNDTNPVFEQNYLAVAQEFDKEADFMVALNKTSKHIQQAKEQFKNVKYAAIMIMLCNSPYALAKYISCSYNHDLNVKSIRSFLSYAISQNVFKPLSILELGRRIFLVLLESFKNRYPIEVVIQNYSEIDLENDSDIVGYHPPDDVSSFEYLMWKSAEAFKKKKNAYANQLQLKAACSPEQSIADKTQKIKSQLHPDSHIDEKDPHQYPFPDIDSDNEINDLTETDGPIKGKKKAKVVPKFDASQQMKSLLQMDKKQHKLFLSTRGEIGNKNFANLSISIRQAGKATNSSGYESNKDLKTFSKSKQKVPHYEEIAQLGESQNIDERVHFPINAQLKMKATQSAAQDYFPRHSAESSPEIMHNDLKVDDKIIEENPSEQNARKFSGISGDFVEQVEEIQLGNSNTQQIQQPQLQKEEQVQQLAQQLFQEPGVMAESTEVINIHEQLSKVLTQINKQAIDDPLVDFSLTLLENYSNDKQVILGVLKELYKHNCNSPIFNRIMKMMGEIVSNYPITGLNSQIFALIVKSQETQAKTIPEIKFTQLISQESLLKQYEDKRSLFEEIYKTLNRYVDSENIYKITRFILRVFDDPQYEQEVIWNFILELCDKIQNSDVEDRNFNLEKIQANLPKVNFSVWNRNIDTFKAKVFNSQCRDQLLQVFCNFIKSKPNNQQSRAFLEKLSQQNESSIIRQALESIKV